MIKKIPNYIKYIFLNVGFLFIYLFIFRLIFYFYVANFDEASQKDLVTAFSYGLRFDLKLAILSYFPLSIIILSANYLFFKKNIFRIVATIYHVITYVSLSIFYLTDIGYYSYLFTRLDATSLRFLSNLKISTQLLIETYPVYKGIIGLFILVLLIRFLGRKLFDKMITKEMPYLSKKIKAVYFISTFLLLSFGVYGSITHYPLRWSEAFFSKNNTVNQFALNPVLNFFDSFAFRNDGADEKLTKAYFPVIASYLNIPKDSLSFERKITFDSTYTKKPNLVIVMLESLGVVGLGSEGNVAKATSYIDQIINESAYFENFYVHKPGTAASVFSSITGLADIDNQKTASRNLRAIDQKIIFDQFDGYKKLYFLGGSANWANIRGVFQSNINDLKIYEEGSYISEERADVWGIDDYDLFKESNKVLRDLHATNEPFVAYIQTATNHRPFSVPEKKETYRPFTKEDIDETTLKESGFISLAQLNALRYLDFNVHVFLRRAKESGYYENTVFAFFGDHNTSMNQTKTFKKEFDLGIQVHHVPLFIHAPKFLKPQKISNTAKLADLFPTLATIARSDHTNYTLGSNALDTLNTDSFGFLYLKINGEPGLGLIQNDFYYTKTNYNNSTSLYKLSDEEKTDVSNIYPIVASKMDSLITSYYHSTKYLYYNNKK
ncbi:MAG: sulfatase-like hydrolase/transferase [Flavobacteriaceae bacterium]|nr:sulfatase-like hydrolase/transferase [Flavobacteriaceae bacterium]